MQTCHIEIIKTAKYYILNTIGLTMQARPREPTAASAQYKIRPHSSDFNEYIKLLNSIASGSSLQLVQMRRKFMIKNDTFDASYFFRCRTRSDRGALEPFALLGKIIRRSAVFSL